MVVIISGHDVGADAMPRELRRECSGEPDGFERGMHRQGNLLQRFAGDDSRVPGIMRSQYQGHALGLPEGTDRFESGWNVVALYCRKDKGARLERGLHRRQQFSKVFLACHSHLPLPAYSMLRM